MRIETKKVSELVAVEYNPRKLTPERKAMLRNSMQTFGLVETLVYNERTGRVVGGAQRLELLRENGVEDVQVSVVDLSEDQEKVLNLQLNNHAGQWDEEKLQGLLDSIDFGVMDEDLTGFTDKELASFSPVEPAGLPVENTSKAKHKTVPLFFLTEDDKAQFFAEADKVAKLLHTPDLTETVRQAIKRLIAENNL